MQNNAFLFHLFCFFTKILPSFWLIDWAPPICIHTSFLKTRFDVTTSIYVKGYELLLRIFFDLGNFLPDMVHCCVPRCTKYSAKTNKAGGIVGYHKIPSQLDLQRAWLARLKRANLPPLKICSVCSEHSEETCFESGTDLQKELIGQRIRRRLKPDAVPTKFRFSTSSGQQTKRHASEKRIKHREREEVTHLQNCCNAAFSA